MHASEHSQFEVVRIYDVNAADGSYRVLVDRLWPRGVTKGEAALDAWAKELAPGSELRRWYGHDPGRFEEFARRYRNELRIEPASDAIARLRNIAKDKRVTLVTATRDVEHSGAQVLRDILLDAG
jgi:uncharacterized protein YeaO (DUF488 family)